MRCKEVKKALGAYMDGEVMPSERTLLEAHLAGCGRCEGELSTLRAARRRIGGSLESMAGQASPSPDALARLQTALAHDSDARTRRQGEHGMRLRWRIAIGTAGAFVLAAAVIAGVPSTRAAAGSFFAGVFHLQVKPVEATYLPEGFEPMPVYVTGSVQVSQPPAGGQAGATMVPQSAEEQQESLYLNGDQFVLVTTSKGADRPMPAGERAEVNGLAAVLETGLSGTVGEPLALPMGEGVRTGEPPATVWSGGSSEDGSTLEEAAVEGGTVVIRNDDGAISGSGAAVRDAGSAPPVIPSLSYQDGSRLTWTVDGTRVEVLSNLPLAELFKIAEGLVLED